MKKAFLIISLSVFFLFSGISFTLAQEAPKPDKDTVNMDTNAKPEFYYSVEDEDTTQKSKSGSSTGTIIAIVGGVVVLAGAAFFLLKKKK